MKLTNEDLFDVLEFILNTYHTEVFYINDFYEVYRSELTENRRYGFLTTLVKLGFLENELVDNGLRLRVDDFRFLITKSGILVVLNKYLDLQLPDSK